MWLTSAWQKHPNAGSFQNCGWVYYMSMQSLILTWAKGANVFHAGQDSSKETIPPPDDDRLDLPPAGREEILWEVVHDY